MLRALSFVCLSLLGTVPAVAEPVVPPDVVQGVFRPGWQTASGTHMAALDLRLAPRWKTYWRAPGDAGIPPHFDWSGSENVAAVQFHWPAPEVFHSNGMQSVGYHDALMLPIEVTPVDPSAPVRLQASIDLGVCKEICVPAHLTLGAILPGTGAPDRAIATALAAQPATAAAAGLRAIRCVIEPIRDGLRITARMDLPAQGLAEVVVFEPGMPGIWVSQSMALRDGLRLEAVADMVPPSGQPFALDRGAVVVTVIGDDGRAVEIRGCPAG